MITRSRSRHALAGQQVLMDTGAYFALADTTETRHPAANDVRQRRTRERWRLLTTNFIVAETHALMLVRLGYHFARRFLDDLDRSATQIIRISPADEERAFAKKLALAFCPSRHTVRPCRARRPPLAPMQRPPSGAVAKNHCFAERTPVSCPNP